MVADIFFQSGLSSKDVCKKKKVVIRNFIAPIILYYNIYNIFFQHIYCGGSLILSHITPSKFEKQFLACLKLQI